MDSWNGPLFWLRAAAISGALAVGLGAFGSHALRARLTPDQLRPWEIGTHYHLLHTVAMVTCRHHRYAPAFFLAGNALFSGSLYALTLTQNKMFGPITPIGGMLYILGWLSLLWN